MPEKAIGETWLLKRPSLVTSDGGPKTRLSGELEMKDPEIRGLTGARREADLPATREAEADSEATGTDSRPEDPVTAQAEAAAHQEPVGSTQDGLEAIPGAETQQREEKGTRGNKYNGKEEESATVTEEKVRVIGGDTGTTPRKPGTTCIETLGATKRLEDREGATSTVDIF